MTETLTYIQHSLRDIYPPEEIRSFTRLILEKVCGIRPHQLLMDKDKELSDTEKEEVKEIVQRLKLSEPIQYILGSTCFYEDEYMVNPSTLIPRPETEELVERVLNDHQNKSLSLLDIGTGSGCIAIALAKRLLKADVTAVDISEKALETAQGNATRLHVSNVSFLRVDILSEEETREKLPRRFDVIVSNPPYVMEKEKVEMEQNVLRYEPDGALFVPDNDPLLFYRRIARLGREKLNPGGCVYFEINAQLGEEMKILMIDEGYRDVLLWKDLSGKDRIIKATI